MLQWRRQRCDPHFGHVLPRTGGPQGALALWRKHAAARCRMPRRFDPDDPECMDRPQPVSPALERDLANLRGLNQWFGARRILGRVLAPVLRSGATVRIADLCTGSGDLPAFLVREGRKYGTRVAVEAVEGHPATFEIGRNFCRNEPSIQFVHNNVLEWEPAQQPDWVICSLALHHFTETDALSLLKKMHAVASAGVLVADLERCWWSTAGIHAASWFYREPMTVEDMRRSAAAAFSSREFQSLACGAGWKPIRYGRFFFGRQAVWSFK